MRIAGYVRHLDHDLLKITWLLVTVVKIFISFLRGAILNTQFIVDMS